jgi:uncharacterized membrane protein YeaQ/YmgE (transglycosylase-associated protein family)
MAIGGQKISIVHERRSKMIGMDFISFLILLVISIVVSAALHFILKFYIMPGCTSYLSKVCIGWVGAWLGSPILGYWPHSISFLNYREVWIVPAILGSFASLILAVDMIKTCATVFKEGKEAAPKKEG